MANYEQNYQNISQWIRRRPIILKLIMFLDKFFPYIVGVFYVFLIAYVYINFPIYTVIKIVLVPFFTFVVVTFIRKLIDAPRPYAKYNITPLIQKERQGESFPSRHTVSVAIIAMAWLYINVYAGCVMWLVVCIIAVLRVISGVHFIKDVICGMAFSILIGIIGLWII